MRLTARARANRRNAKRSTGPRTAAGKARVAKNALKHGLAVPVLETSGAESRVDEMARAIAGASAEPMRLELARRIAEAQLDLIRVQQFRRLLFDNPEARRKQVSGHQKVKDAIRMLDLSERILAIPDQVAETNELVMTVFREFQRLVSEKNAPPPSLEEGIGNLAPQLLALDRYERRAMSRRKRATRAFDAYDEAQGQGGGGTAAGIAVKICEKSDAD